MMESTEDLETGPVIKVRTGTQFSYLPFTPLPKAFEGKTVRIVIVPETIESTELFELEGDL